MIKFSYARQVLRGQASSQDVSSDCLCSAAAQALVVLLGENCHLRGQLDLYQETSTVLTAAHY